eukprot:Colp12_sorted_trinity150504_noHs@27338
MDFIAFEAGPEFLEMYGSRDSATGASDALLSEQKQTCSKMDPARSARRKLIMASVFCAVFMVGEVVGGFFSGSLAIMTDAAHLMSDLAGFLISLVAIWISQRPASAKLSFGFHRAEIIGALMSVLLIWVLTGVLIYEGVQRVLDPPEVEGKIMFITAACGVVVNIILGVILHQHGHTHGLGSHTTADEEEGADHGDSHGHGHGHSHGHGHNINVRAAFIHAVGDLIQSIGVMIAAIVLWVKPSWTLIDPICTFVFCVLVLFTTIGIMRDAMHVLMEGVPKGLDISKLTKELGNISGVLAVHDLHVWSLTVGKAAISAHLDVEESSARDVLLAAQALACSKYHIHHTTFQIETQSQPSALGHCTGGPCELVCSSDCAQPSALGPAPAV